MTDVEKLSLQGSPRRPWRSAGAIGAGMIAVIALSLVTDQVLHVLNVYPRWGKPMFDPGLNVLALSYRSVYNVVGAYLTATLAPRNPSRHLWIFAFIGFALGAIGAIATSPMHLGPAWYPILLAVSAFPCTWLGWVVYRARHSIAANR